MIEDINPTAAGIAGVIGLVVFVFLFIDPLSMGMKDLSLVIRLSVLVLSLPLNYFVVQRMID